MLLPLLAEELKEVEEGDAKWKLFEAHRCTFYILRLAIFRCSAETARLATVLMCVSDAR